MVVSRSRPSPPHCSSNGSRRMSHSDTNFHLSHGKAASASRSVASADSASHHWDSPTSRSRCSSFHSITSASFASVAREFGGVQLVRLGPVQRGGEHTHQPQLLIG